MTIKVVYENGVFRPLKPARIKEGTEAEVTLQADAGIIASPQEVIDSFMAIVNLPQPDNGRKFDGTDHDKILYGDPHQ